MSSADCTTERDGRGRKPLNHSERLSEMPTGAHGSWSRVKQSRYAYRSFSTASRFSLIVPAGNARSLTLFSDHPRAVHSPSPIEVGLSLSISRYGQRALVGVRPEAAHLGDLAGGSEQAEAVTNARATAMSMK